MDDKVVVTEPEVHLVNWTPRPIDTMLWAFSNMHLEIPPYPIPEYSDKEQAEFMETLKKIPHQTVMEFVSVVWYIKGSRALQQQLTRTRLAAYSIQSLRIAEAKPQFYARKDVAEKMEPFFGLIHQGYSELKDEMATEDARGILPLNVMSPITMSINFRAFKHMLAFRLCDNAQEEIRDMAKMMKREVHDKMSPMLAELLIPVCEEEGGICRSPVPCGRFGGDAGKVNYGNQWIKG
jgi:flavin-dependent thymidylate synthase